MAEPSKEAQNLKRELTRAAKEMSTAATRMSEAAEAAQLTWRDYQHVFRALRDAGVEFETVGRARIGPIAIAGLPEEEAALIADESVHRIRKGLVRERTDQQKAPPPSPDEIAEWQQRRDERRRREA